MQKKQITSPAAPMAYVEGREAREATTRRKTYARLAAMQRLAIAEITEQTGVLLPPRVWTLITSIQGARGGGKVPHERVRASYRTLAKHMGFEGSRDAMRSRVRDVLKLLDKWQQETGFTLFDIFRGGKIKGYDDDGQPDYTQTEFIDYLLPAADCAVERAHKTDVWKRHPGIAMQAQVFSLLAELPRTEARERIEKPKAPPAPRTLLDIEKELMQLIEEGAELLRKQGDDGADWAERMSNDIHRASDSLRRTGPARLDALSLETFEDAPAAGEDRAPDAGDPSAKLPPPGVTNMGKETAPDAPEETGPAAEGGGKENITPPSRQTRRLQLVSPGASAKSDGRMLKAALLWASRGVAVFPCHTVRDGACSCKAGPDCQRKGKHPRIMEAYRHATTDEAQINRWWQGWPDANIGGATGARSGLYVVDVDSKSNDEGFKTLYALAEANGQESFNTYRVITGSGGYHFFFALSDSLLDLACTVGKLGAGIDTRGTGGHVILPPSMHASGKRYRAAKGEFNPSPLPAWVVDIVSATDRPEQNDFEFQAASIGARAGDEVFKDGERNNQLFRIGIGRWLHGWAQDGADLAAQLVEINRLRCMPPLDAPEVRGMAEHIARDYATQRGACKRSEA